jgi:hypothetical protein
MNINLHIERLILDGLHVPTSQGFVVQAAVEAQLANLLRSEGLSPELRAGGVLRSVKAGGIHVANGSPKHLGQQIGRAVYDGIGNKPK